MESFKVETSYRKAKVHDFLNDLIELCSKHKVSLETESCDIGTEIIFHGWDSFSNLEVDAKTASLYWPRIQTDIIVRRKNEQRKSKEDC